MQQFLTNKNLHRLIVFFLAFGFYYGTFKNDFAYDDILVISGNKFVQKGTLGIGDILRYDSFYGATGKTSFFSGGRYRPLSLVSFAIEKQFFGNKPFVFHFFHIIYYAVLCLLILYFLQHYIFKYNPFAAFITVVLFTCHPVHTEVVSNIKSRDEIFSLMFLILTLFWFFRYLDTNKRKFIAASLISFALALLSKEHGVIFIAVIPLATFIYKKADFKSIVIYSLPFLLVIAGYIYLRYSVNTIGSGETIELLNNPYMFATFSQRIASVAWVFLLYLKLIFWPDHLTTDYGYNHLAVQDIANPFVWVAIAINLLMLIYGIFFVIRKNSIGFCIMYYFMALFLVSGLLVNIGVPLAERFLFAPGLFFIIAFMLVLQKYLPGLFKQNFMYMLMMVVPIVLLSYYKVSARNEDWKNTKAIYSADVKTSPQSVRLLTFYASTLVSETDTIADPALVKEQLMEAIPYYEKAFKIYPEFSSMYNNWGLAYYRLNNIDSAEWAWRKLKEMKPNSIFNEQNDEAIATARYNIYYQLFLKAREKNNAREMLLNLRTAVSYYDKMPASFVALGQLYMINNQRDSAIISWNRCLQLDPANETARKLLNQYKTN
jgi:protein O-mannosyl-transferase